MFKLERLFVYASLDKQRVGEGGRRDSIARDVVQLRNALEVNAQHPTRQQRHASALRQLADWEKPAASLKLGELRIKKNLSNQAVKHLPLVARVRSFSSLFFFISRNNAFRGRSLVSLIVYRPSCLESPTL